MHDERPDEKRCHDLRNRRCDIPHAHRRRHRSRREHGRRERPIGGHERAPGNARDTSACVCDWKRRRRCEHDEGNHDRADGDADDEALIAAVRRLCCQDRADDRTEREGEEDECRRHLHVLLPDAETVSHEEEQIVEQREKADIHEPARDQERLERTRPHARPRGVIGPIDACERSCFTQDDGHRRDEWNDERSGDDAQIVHEARDEQTDRISE